MWKVQCKGVEEDDSKWEDVGLNTIEKGRLRTIIPKFPTREKAERAMGAWQLFAEVCGVAAQVEHRIVSVETFAVEEVSP